MRILIVEDDRATAQLLGMLLTSAGHSIVQALDGGEGLKQLRSVACDLVITDVVMVPMDGFEFLANARAEFPRMLVVLASACTDLHARIEQQPHKPFDVVHKPFRIEEVRRVLARAEEALAVQAEVARAAGAVTAPAAEAATDRLEATLVRLFPGPAYALTRASLNRAMSHAGPALIAAGSGLLGPEMLELWRSRVSAGTPWHVVDVGIDPAEATAALFGAAGAGPAVTAARGGTLVVLHAERLSLETQGRLPPLLRQQPPVRLLLHVSRDPEVLLEQGGLDEALYFRLSSQTVTIPSLTEFAEDVDTLFVEALRGTPGYPFGATDVAIEPVALSALRAHRWPDNLVELRSVAAWSLMRMRSPRVTLAHLPERFHRARLATLAEVLGSTQREHLRRALRLCPSKREAAAAMGVQPEELVAGIEDTGPLLFSLGPRVEAKPTVPAAAAALPPAQAHPGFLLVTADEELRFAAEAQLAGLGLVVHAAADGLQAISKLVMAPERPRIVMIAGPTAPFEPDELVGQLRRIAPDLVVALVGVGQESDTVLHFPALESMDLFPVIVAHLMEAAA